MLTNTLIQYREPQYVQYLSSNQSMAMELGEWGSAGTEPWPLSWQIQLLKADV